MILTTELKEGAEEQFKVQARRKWPVRGKSEEGHWKQTQGVGHKAVLEVVWQVGRRVREVREAVVALT